MNASRNPINRPNPAAVAAAATVISTLILGGVIGLFASDSPSGATAVAQRAPAPLAQQVDAKKSVARLAANTMSSGRL